MTAPGAADIEGEMQVNKKFRMAAFVLVIALLWAMMPHAALGTAYLWYDYTPPNPEAPLTGSFGWWDAWYTDSSPLPNSSDFWWTNQPVTVAGWWIYDSNDGSVLVSSVRYRFNDGVPISLANTLTVTAPGLYSVVATGTKNNVTYEASRTIGYDVQRPTSHSNVLPVYDRIATVTVTATDTVSGANSIFYTLDNAPDAWSLFTRANKSSIDVTAGVGAHMLNWFVVDNAGNLDSRQTVNFAVNPDGFVPTLSKVSVKVKKRTVTLTGATTPITAPATVKLVVQRKAGKKFKAYANYFVTLPKFSNSYVLTKKLSKAGTFQVKAYEGTATSPGWVSFKLK